MFNSRVFAGMLLFLLVLPLLSQSVRAAAEFTVTPTAQSTIHVILVPPPQAALSQSMQAKIRSWVERAAAALVTYAGWFPVPQAYLSIQVTEGVGVHGGRAFATDPPTVAVNVGRYTTAGQLAEDWILIHEMAHLFVPNLPKADRWFEEGFAGYIEAVARAKTGLRGTRETWQALHQGVPQGTPRPGEGGLHGTVRWGRVYWASVVFMVESEVRMHDLGAGWTTVMAAWRQHGWDIRRPATLSELFAIADSTLPSPVLRPMYATYGARLGPWDPNRWWWRLGLVDEHGDFYWAEDTPQALLRESLTQPDQ